MEEAGSTDLLVLLCVSVATDGSLSLSVLERVELAVELVPLLEQVISLVLERRDRRRLGSNICFEGLDQLRVTTRRRSVLIFEAERETRTDAR